VHRVTVRGRFIGLDQQKRAYLAREQPEHEIFKSAYTPEGSFTYDERIQFFNLRYEIRTSEGTDDAGTTGRREAEQFLRTLGFPHSELKVDVVDVSAIWNR
jgi:hypothetical protein